MKAVVAVIALLVLSGCAAKKPQHKQVFVFQGVHPDGTCDVDSKLSHWDAKRGAFVVVCK